MYEIPIEAVPDQTFDVELGRRRLTIRIRWLSVPGLFAVDVYERGAPVTLGRGLHPGIDIVKGLNTGLGRLYLDGRPPTLSNLGSRNRLLYEEPDGAA